MNTPIKNLREELQYVKSKGRKMLSIDRLLEYCEITEGEPCCKSLNEAELVRYKATEDQKMQLWRSKVDYDMLGSKYAYDTAAQCLKAILIVAGGSCAALLGFIGKVWDAENRFLLVDAMGYFAAATFLGSLVYGLTYLTTLLYYEADWHKTGHMFRIMSIVCGAAAFVMTAGGFWKTYEGLRQKGTPLPAAAISQMPQPAPAR